LSSAETVTFYYDHKTRWITDSHHTTIFTIAGNFQRDLGCRSNFDANCLRTWLEDPTGSGFYTLITRDIPPGDYEAVVAINRSLKEAYGRDGIQGGRPYRFRIKEAGVEVYFRFNPKTHRLYISTDGIPKGNLEQASAHWVSRDTFLWSVPAKPDYQYFLHYDPAARMYLERKGIRGGKTIPLSMNPAGPGQDLEKKFPHLSGFTTLKLPTGALQEVPQILRGQMAISILDRKNNLVDAASIQIPGVLDDLYTYDGKLGVSFENGKPVLRVWAPTAISVKLRLYSDPQTGFYSTITMMRDDSTGVWSTMGEAGWRNQYYLYEVEVYAPSTEKIEENLVTDPYSISLSMNSQRSQIVDLSDPAWMPEGWADLTPEEKPVLDSPQDIIIGELHVRDFSAWDESVPSQYRGTYKAFTVKESNGMLHLQDLAKAGLTHIHLLPVFDFVTVNEDKSTWHTPGITLLVSFPGDSDQQQALVSQDKDRDGYNWGYDPYHFTTPEGSYATDPNGALRIREFREMVQSLNQAGLRVIMDVVYNHTHASGQAMHSVLDKVVPGYYHRLNAVGAVETSTCCANTAAEHAMMEKLMIDSLVTWATAYKVDGFRFDLMGFHMYSTMEKVSRVLSSLEPLKNGVDGKKIYLYGEGWNIGEVANNARGRNASQHNMGGLKIGLFNDRLRDGMRGGNPFDPPQTQGFLTGLYYNPNGASPELLDKQKWRLLQNTDWIRIGLAGNLADYEMESYLGIMQRGADIEYYGSRTGYTKNPSENIVFVSAHDNETLFDAVQIKAAPDASLNDRIRMQNLANALVLLSQGIPFFQIGDELLRSKSLDRNSFNSGDWFNRLDFTYQMNNYAVGLPVAQENESRWSMMRPLLANPALKPGKGQILFAGACFEEFMRIRKSSPLFRLQTADAIKNQLSFFNTGPDQTPGLIVMRLSDRDKKPLDHASQVIVVFFNASHLPATFQHDDFKQVPLKLHPIQARSVDPVVRTSNFNAKTGAFKIPGRSAVVFVKESI
ncbi:MAG: pullulanase-type alpha-1,6-glucosidase, partial [Omnitrophica WOR_2 bacterium]